MFFRAELRRRWRAWLAVALIVGAFVGVVEAAAAGARRTDAAYPSLLAWSDAPDVLLFSFPGTSGTFAQFSPREAAAIPQARQAAILAGYPVASPAAAQVIAPESTLVPSRFWRRRILSGRLPDPARPDEVDISFTLAQATHLGAGDVLRATLLTPAAGRYRSRSGSSGSTRPPQSSRRRPGRAPTRSGRPRPSTGRTAPASTTTRGSPSGSGTGLLTCLPSGAR